MSKTPLFEVSSKPIAPEVLGAYKNGRLDIRAIPKGDSSAYQLQAWAVAIYGASDAAAFAYGTVLKKIGLVLGSRTKRHPNDPGGEDHNRWLAAYGQGEPRGKPMKASPPSAYEAIAAGVVEDLAKAGHHPVNGREDAAIVALSNIMAQVYRRAMTPPAPPQPRVAEDASPKIKRRFIIEEPAPEHEELIMKEPPAFQVNDRIRDKMAGLLTNVAKDMLRGDRVRLLPLKHGNLRTTVQVQFRGIEEEDGLPVAYLSATVPSVKRDADGNQSAAQFATVRLYYEIPDRHVSKPPGRKDIWAEIEFNINTRGHELAREFAQWVHQWRPIHIHAQQTGKGDARKGAMNSPHHNFIRTDITVNLKNKPGFQADGPIVARLMLAPMTKKPAKLDDGLRPARIFMLVRTDEERDATAVRNIEEDVLVAASSAYEYYEDEKGNDAYTNFTLFGLVFRDDFHRRTQDTTDEDSAQTRNAAKHDEAEQQEVFKQAEKELLGVKILKDEFPEEDHPKRYLVDALLYAVNQLAARSDRMPNSFVLPTQYPVLAKSLGAEVKFWDHYANPRCSTA